MSSLFAHIMEPGSSLKLLPIIRLAALALIVVCSCMIYMDIGRIHMVVLIALSLGLMGSVQWLVSILEADKGGKLSD